ncbi:PH domain-containing protein [Pradoshia sp.]
MNEKKRYHPAIILFNIASFIKENFFIIIILFIINFNSTSKWIIWGRYALIALFLVYILYSILKWYIETYEITREAFIFREGVLVKKQRNIPFERIQDHHSKANFLHQLLGITSLKLETGTSDKDANLSFPAISLKEETRILENLLKKERKIAADVQHEEERVIYFESTNKDIIRAAFTSFSFLALFPLLLTGYFQLDEWLNIEETSKQVLNFFERNIWIWLPLVLVTLGAAFAVGYLQTLFKYGNFVISADKDRIYITRGVFTTNAYSIQKSRVQAIKIQQSLLKRLFGMVEIKLVSAGQEIIGEETEINSLYPFMDKKKAYQLVNQLLPDYHIVENMHRLPKKVLWLKLIRPYYLTFAAVIILVFVKREWLYAAAIVLLAEIIFRVLDYQFTRYLKEDEYIQVREGGLYTRTIHTKWRNLQQIEVSHSWLQRRFGVATIQFYNRAKPFQLTILMDLSKEESVAFYERFCRRSVRHEGESR